MKMDSNEAQPARGGSCSRALLGLGHRELSSDGVGQRVDAIGRVIASSSVAHSRRHRRGVDEAAWAAWRSAIVHEYCMTGRGDSTEMGCEMASTYYMSINVSRSY
nr:hypothetical protein CFP56_73806 [Quercus suber]